MIHYILVLVTLSLQTGEVASSETIGEPYETVAECLRVAIDKGPQRVGGGAIRMYSCDERRDDVV
jgi:hypothetical protein